MSDQVQSVLKFRYRQSAADKIAAAGHVIREREVHTLGDFDDALHFINARYPGAAVSYSDMEVLP